MDIEKEQWFDRIRSFAPKIKQAHEELARAEAEVKKVEAVLMTEAMGNGIKLMQGRNTLLKLVICSTKLDLELAFVKVS